MWSSQPQIRHPCYSHRVWFIERLGTHTECQANSQPMPGPCQIASVHVHVHVHAVLVLLLLQHKAVASRGADAGNVHARAHRASQADGRQLPPGGQHDRLLDAHAVLHGAAGRVCVHGRAGTRHCFVCSLTGFLSHVSGPPCSVSVLHVSDVFKLLIWSVGRKSKVRHQLKSEAPLELRQHEQIQPCWRCALQASEVCTCFLKGLACTAGFRVGLHKQACRRCMLRLQRPSRRGLRLRPRSMSLGN